MTYICSIEFKTTARGHVATEVTEGPVLRRAPHLV